MSRIIALTDEEIDCFNSYIEDLEGTEMDINFENSDWCDIYLKIVGDKVSDYAKRKSGRIRMLYEKVK